MVKNDQRGAGQSQVQVAPDAGRLFTDGVAMRTDDAMRFEGRLGGFDRSGVVLLSRKAHDDRIETLLLSPDGTVLLTTGRV